MFCPVTFIHIWEDVLDLKKFKSPDSILRPAPFWAINDKIDAKETARQMEDMLSVGLSGGFFHSRHGLITQYLGEEWFESLDAAIDVAAKKDGYVWLYDEDLWPSGNAGGLVAGMKDEYRSATLLAVLVAEGVAGPELTGDQEPRFCYVIHKREGTQLVDCEQIEPEKMENFAENERLVLYRNYTAKIGWWGGESYANLLHPEAMKEFARLTHDAYKKRVGKHFGDRVPGIFTDEPQVAFASTGFAWYDGLPQKYAKWHGRDFAKDVPFMFFDGPEARKIRLLIHRTILRQFLEAYSEPLYKWCEENGIEHTGHYNAEDSFHGQIICHSGGIMSHYRYQQAPGIDHLCRLTNHHLFTLKQVASAARQLGRKRVLTEIFGVSRHTNTFEDFKWLGDYDLVLGANFFCPHLTWYSAKGRRKRDYPPVWNYQQTYWKDLNPLNDYFTRIGYALTCGKAECNTVMMQSIESATSARRLGVELKGKEMGASVKLPAGAPTEDMSAAHVFDQQMRKSLHAVLNAGHECDIGDENYLEDLGRVDGDKFIIGEMAYSLVILPTATTWRPKTFEMLQEFVKGGGKVIVLGELPAEIDCEPAKDKWAEFASHENVMSLPCSQRELQDAVDELALDSFTLKDSNGCSVYDTFLHHRKDGDEDIFFVANSSRDCGHDYRLVVKGAAGKSVNLLEPVTGECYSVHAGRIGDDLEYCFTLPPVGSCLVTVGAKQPDCGKGYGPLPDLSVGEKQVVSGPFDFERSEENVLVLDRISISLDGGKTFESEELEWRVRKQAAGHFGTTDTLHWQPWVAIRKGLFEGRGGDIVLRYRFISDVNKPGCFAVIEDIGKGTLTVNGQEVDVQNAGWHFDRGFGKVDISELVKVGENTMDFAVHYDHLTEIESAYIVGDFAVRMAGPFMGVIAEENKKLEAGPWNEQGYPFYSGKITYKSKFNSEGGRKTYLRLNRPSGTLFKVRVNGENVQEILWRPYVCDISDFVKSGENTVEIEVVSSLQNSLGPIHEKEGDDDLWCGPDAFEEEHKLREEINSFPYGLLGGVEVVKIYKNSPRLPIVRADLPVVIL